MLHYILDWITGVIVRCSSSHISPDLLRYLADSRVRLRYIDPSEKKNWINPPVIFFSLALIWLSELSSGIIFALFASSLLSEVPPPGQDHIRPESETACAVDIFGLCDLARDGTTIPGPPRFSESSGRATFSILVYSGARRQMVR